MDKPEEQKECPECAKLREKLDEAERRMVKYVDQLLHIKRILLFDCIATPRS